MSNTILGPGARPFQGYDWFPPRVNVRAKQAIFLPGATLKSWWYWHGATLKPTNIFMPGTTPNPLRLVGEIYLRQERRWNHNAELRHGQMRGWWNAVEIALFDITMHIYIYIYMYIYIYNNIIIIIIIIIISSSNNNNTNYYYYYYFHGY